MTHDDDITIRIYFDYNQYSQDRSFKTSAYSKRHDHNLCVLCERTENSAEFLRAMGDLMSGERYKNLSVSVSVSRDFLKHGDLLDAYYSVIVFIVDRFMNPRNKKFGLPEIQLELV